MKRQFTVITKDGIKWLRPIKSATMPPHWGLNMPSLPYLGNHPEGTSLSEEQVKPRRQVLYNGVWQQFKRPIPNGNYETRIAYTDAEPHDRHIRPFNTQNVRPLVNQLVGEEISFSRFIELLNEIANTH